MELRAGWGHGFVYSEELLEDGFEVVQVEGVGSVGFGLRRVVVNLEEDAVYAGGCSGAGKDGDELGLASADAVAGGGSLDGVGAVEDDGREGAHDRKRTHVDDEVVVAEAGAALGEGDAVAAALADLLDGVAHVEGGYELALLHVDSPAVLVCGLGGCDEEIGLAAEEGGDLEDVDGFGYGGAVFGGVDVGEDWKTVVLSDGAEDASAFDEAGAAEALDGGAVGLVVAGLEDVGDAEVGGDALDGVGHGAGVLLGFDDTGPGDEEELAAAYRDAADVEWIGHECYFITVAREWERVHTRGVSCARALGAFRSAGLEELLQNAYAVTYAKPKRTRQALAVNA
ncbi:MAG: hypothetical protein JWP98_1273 [Edaphobacter sp.]|nr:hypothetical protein [Edaphobacter sp.]